MFKFTKKLKINKIVKMLECCSPQILAYHIFANGFVFWRFSFWQWFFMRKSPSYIKKWRPNRDLVLLFPHFRFSQNNYFIFLFLVRVFGISWVKLILTFIWFCFLIYFIFHSKNQKYIISVFLFSTTGQYFCMYSSRGLFEPHIFCDMLKKGFQWKRGRYHPPAMRKRV